MSNWKGTAVPNSGVYQTIYINTALSTEEVVNILEELNFISLSDFETYPVMSVDYSSTGGNEGVNYSELTVFKVEGQLMIMAGFNPIFDSAVGWYDGIETSLINTREGITFMNATDSDEGLIPVGAENDKLSSLFSITPFTQNEPITNLPEFLTGIADAIREVKGTTEKINAQNYKPEILKFKELIGSGGDPEWDGDYSEEGELPKPEGTLDITENGEYDVTEKANVNVNVVGSGGGNRLKAFFDVKKNCYYEFHNSSVTAEELNNILSYEDTSNVTSMVYMFNSCSNLTTIPQLDTSNVTDMGAMFNYCSNLTTIPQLDTSKVTNMSGMFNYCFNLTTIPQLDTSNVTDMGGMFTSCGKLTTIPQLDTSNVTNMNSMFNSCSNLTTIPQLDTSNVTDMGAMFNYCFNLTTIPQLDTSKVTNTSIMFRSCKNLTSVVLHNIKVNLTVGSGTSYGHLLTVDSLVGLCKECIKQSSSRTLTVGTANIEKLSTVTVKFTDSTIVPSETAIAVGEKGDVVVCESTDEGAMYISEYMSLKNWSLA